MDENTLRHNFAYHKPSPIKALMHESIRSNAGSLAEYFNEILPESREKFLAITKLEEAMMWANAALARHRSN